MRAHHESVDLAKDRHETVLAALAETLDDLGKGSAVLDDTGGIDLPNVIRARASRLQITGADVPGHSAIAPHPTDRIAGAFQRRQRRSRVGGRVEREQRLGDVEDRETLGEEPLHAKLQGLAVHGVAGDHSGSLAGDLQRLAREVTRPSRPGSSVARRRTRARPCLP